MHNRKHIVGFWMLILALIVHSAWVLAEDTSAVHGIAQLKEETSDTWAGSYSAYDRMIEFEAPIYLPDVNAMPILGVKRINIPADAAKDFGKLLQKNTIYGQRIVDDRAYALPDNAVHCYTEFYHNLWAKDVHTNDVYAENQSISLQDAVDFLKNMTEKMYGTEGVGCLPYLAGIKSCKYYNEGKAGTLSLGSAIDCGELTEKGGYYIESWQTLRDIPVFMGVERPFSKVGNRSAQSALSNASWIILGEYIADNYYVCVSTSIWGETRQLSSDTPLCSFDKIQREIEKWIQAGRIRDIYSIALGYAIFANPEQKYPNHEDAYTAEYLAVPTWCVECKYAENAAKELPETVQNSLDTPSYHNERGWKNILIHAQTGEIIDPEDSSGNRFYANRQG